MIAWLRRKTENVICHGSSEVGKLSIRRAAPIGHNLPDIPDMANVALKPTPAPSVFTDECLRTIIVAILAYLGAFRSGITSHEF